LSRLLSLSAAALLLAGLVAGLAIWGGYAGVTAYVTTNAFCGTACHEMQTVAGEYQQSIHFRNPAGVRAQCADCHVPKPFLDRVIHMAWASTEILAHVRGTIDTPEKFEAGRLAFARGVWAEMAANGSQGCRTCHTMDAMDFAHQRPKAAEAMRKPPVAGESCITCHKGVAHHLPVVSLKDVAAATGATTFIGKPLAPMAPAAGSPAFATLYVSTPVAVVGKAGGATHITAKLWLKGDAVDAGALFAARDGLETGHLSAALPANAKPGASANGWTQVTLDGFVAGEAVVPALDAVWDDADTLYQFSCGGCHQLYAPAAYSPTQWQTEMGTMTTPSHLRPDEAMLVLKWLQTSSAAGSSGP
jgi:trimethylamine-N-oxide reductase cytochrome c-type subunit TorC